MIPTDRKRLLILLTGSVAGSVACFALMAFVVFAFLSWIFSNSDRLIGNPLVRIVPAVLFALYIPALSAVLVYLAAKAKRKRATAQTSSKHSADPYLSIVR